MSYTLLNKFLIFIAFASLMHTAYSAVQHRIYLRVTDQTNTTAHLPMDIIVQGVISLFIIIYSLLQLTTDFKEIRATVHLQEKSWETLGNIQSFYSFNHRGKALSPNFQGAH